MFHFEKMWTATINLGSRLTIKIVLLFEYVALEPACSMILTFACLSVYILLIYYEINYY